MVARKRLNKPDPTKLILTEIMAAVEQLFVREKYEVYIALRRDPALKAYRELKCTQRERIRAQTALQTQKRRHGRRVASGFLFSQRQK